MIAKNFVVFCVCVCAASVLWSWRAYNAAAFLNVRGSLLSPSQDDSELPSHPKKQPSNSGEHSPRQCQPQRHVFYHKVPKTGSSTFAGILNALVFKYNLTTYNLRRAYPHPNEVLKSLHLPQASNDSKFQMQVSHGTLNERKIATVMESDTVYVATIRHPFQQFRSHFFYNHHRHGMKAAEREFENMAQTSYVDPTTNKYVFANRRSYEKLESNMFRYFGFDRKKALLNRAYFEDCLSHITDLFIIVITDYYDESLLLLKERLCWDIKDIIFLSHKNASYQGKDKKPSDYSIYEKHRNISQLDYKLYDHFLNLHQRQVKAAGPLFPEKLALYQSLKSDASAFCGGVDAQLLREKDPLNIRRILAQVKVFARSTFFQSFVISGSDCVILSMCEIDLAKARMALNYPILCQKDDRRIEIDKVFCHDKNQSETAVFHHNNLYFPFSKLKKLLHCDLELTYP